MNERMTSPSQEAVLTSFGNHSIQRTSF